MKTKIFALFALLLFVCAAACAQNVPEDGLYTIGVASSARMISSLLSADIASPPNQKLNRSPKLIILQLSALVHIIFADTNAVGIISFPFNT